MIKSFKVSNFKSISSAEVNFDHVTVLVGKSGAGKSNFLESMVCLRNLIRSDSFRNHWQSWLPVSKVKKSAAEKTIRFEVAFLINGLDSLFYYKLEILGAATLHESLAIGETTIFAQDASLDRQGRVANSSWSVEPNVANPPKPGTICIRQLSGLHEVVLAYTALTTGIGFYDFPDNVLTAQKGSGVGGLNENGSNYVGVLQQMTTNLRDFTSRRRIVCSLQCINPTVNSVEVDDVLNPRNVIVGHTFKDRTLSLLLPQESVGFRKFYAHLLALFQDPPKLLLMFEHPEDGVHPGAMQLLAEEFKAASSEQRGQVIFTTHNPELLDFFDVEMIRVVERKGFETQIGKVSTEQQKAIKQQLMDTGELLTSDPATIDSKEPDEQ